MKNHWQVSKFLPLHKIFSPKQINIFSYYYHKVCSKFIEKYEVNEPSNNIGNFSLNYEQEMKRLYDITGISNNSEIINIKESFGNYYQDIDGNNILDMSMNNGFNVLGYNPRSIVTKTKLQAFQQYEVNSFNKVSSLEYTSDLRELNKLAPLDIELVHLSQTNESAIDEAVRLACLGYITQSSNIESTKKFKVITLEGGNYQNVNTVQASFPVIEFPYIDFYTENIKEEEKCIKLLRDLIHEQKNNGYIIPAMVIEPIQFKSGLRYASRNYYKSAQKICQEEGIKLIIDETYTCGWVTGRPFAFYDWCSDITPDIVAFGGRMQLSGFYFKRNLVDLDKLNEFNLRFNFRSNADLSKLNYLLYLNKEVYKRDWLDLHSSDFIASIRTEINEINKYSSFKIKNLRGQGKMFAFDVEHRILRDELIFLARKNGFKISGLGENTIVFTPSLYFTEIHFSYFKKFLIEVKPTTQYFSKI